MQALTLPPVEQTLIIGRFPRMVAYLFQLYILTDHESSCPIISCVKGVDTMLILQF